MWLIEALGKVYLLLERLRMAGIGRSGCGSGRPGGGAAPDPDGGVVSVTWEEMRERLRSLSDEVEEWAGIPTPLADFDLVLEPTHPLARSGAQQRAEITVRVSTLASR